MRASSWRLVSIDVLEVGVNTELAPLALSRSVGQPNGHVALLVGHLCELEHVLLVLVPRGARDVVGDREGVVLINDERHDVGLVGLRSHCETSTLVHCGVELKLRVTTSNTTQIEAREV